MIALEIATELHRTADDSPSGGRPRRCPGTQEFVLDDELLLYEAQSELVFSLNRSAHAVWTLCDGAATVEEIADQIGREVARPGDELLSDVVEAVGQLVQTGLVEMLCPTELA